MTDVSVEPTLDAWASRRAPLLAVAGVVVLLLLASALYVRVGWWRMESSCGADAPGQTHATVSYGWSWTPLGFQCTYGNGDTATSLWP